MLAGGDNEEKSVSWLIIQRNPSGVGPHSPKCRRNIPFTFKLTIPYCWGQKRKQMLVQHCTTPVLYRFDVVVVAGWIPTTILGGRGCLRERIHAQLLHINQFYPLMEADKVANVSSALHKASTVPIRCGCRTDSDNDIRKRVSSRTNSRTALAYSPILSTNGGRQGSKS